MKPTEDTKTNPGYERADADHRIILYFVIGMGAFIVLMMILMAVLYYYLDGMRVDQARLQPNLTDSGQIPPAPRLQADPEVDMNELQDWEDRRLNSYEWIDRDLEVFRIPIDRAIEITAQNQLPARRSSAEEEL